MRDSVRIALDRIRDMVKSDDSPFFFFFHTFQIHSPYTPGGEYQNLFTDRDYRGGLIGDLETLKKEAKEEDWGGLHAYYWAQLDASDPKDLEHLIGLYDGGIRVANDHLAWLLDQLDGDGLLANTVVIVLSDHGEEFMEHGKFIHEQVYQELLHVPLIIRFPGERGRTLAGRRESALVRLIDVAPTLFDFLEIPIPAHMQGESLMPLIERGGAAPPRTVMSSWSHSKLHALQQGTWKLVVKGDTEKLYHRSEDSQERRNLAARNPTERKRMRRQLAERSSAAKLFLSGVNRDDGIRPDGDALEELRALGYVQE